MKPYINPRALMIIKIHQIIINIICDLGSSTYILQTLLFRQINFLLFSIS